MTPREIAGCLHFAGIRKKRERLATMSMMAAASRGDPRKMRAEIKKLTREVE